MTPGCSDEAYKAVGREMSWDILGTAVDENHLAELRDQPGTLLERRWETLSWAMPEKETDPCWWLLNDTDEDKSNAPSFLSRSLACLRLSHGHSIYGTSVRGALRGCLRNPIRGGSG